MQGRCLEQVACTAETDARHSRRSMLLQRQCRAPACPRSQRTSSSASLSKPCPLYSARAGLFSASTCSERLATRRSCCAVRITSCGRQQAGGAQGRWFDAGRSQRPACTPCSWMWLCGCRVTRPASRQTLGAFKEARLHEAACDAAAAPLGCYRKLGDVCVQAYSMVCQRRGGQGL